MFVHEVGDLIQMGRWVGDDHSADAGGSFSLESDAAYSGASTASERCTVDDDDIESRPCR